ncbi:MAG: hypothetical protein ACK56I_04405, partial [bacterium]
AAPSSAPARCGMAPGVTTVCCGFSTAPRLASSRCRCTRRCSRPAGRRRCPQTCRACSTPSGTRDARRLVVDDHGPRQRGFDRAGQGHHEAVGTVAEPAPQQVGVGEGERGPQGQRPGRATPAGAAQHAGLERRVFDGSCDDVRAIRIAVVED